MREEDTPNVQWCLDHISDADTYGDCNDTLDTTTYSVTDSARLEEPFSQTELRKVHNGEPIDENVSRHPACVSQQPGDFPDFPYGRGTLTDPSTPALFREILIHTDQRVDVEHIRVGQFGPKDIPDVSTGENDPVVLAAVIAHVE